MLSHSFLSFTFESSLVLPVFYSWLKQNGVTLRRNIFYLNSIHTFRTWLLIQQDGPISLLSKCIPNNHWLEISPTNQIAYPRFVIGRLDVYWLTDSTTYRWLVCFKQCCGSGSGRIRSFWSPGSGSGKIPDPDPDPLSTKRPHVIHIFSLYKIV